jgi:hypothetical protein
MKTIRVTLELTDPILGTVPKSKQIYSDYIATKNPDGVDESEVVDVKEAEEKCWTGFMEDEEGIYLADYLVKGFLKYAGNVLKEALNIQALKSKVNDFVFVSPRKIRFLNSVSIPVKSADGVLERPLRAHTPMGERVALARSDIVNPGRQISFTLTLLPHKLVKVSTIKSLLDYGQFQGLGQWRNAGKGRFKVILFEEIASTEELTNEE